MLNVLLFDVLLLGFVIIAWIVFWLVGLFAERRLKVPSPKGVQFASRFPERQPYTSEQLNEFVRLHPDRARFYIWPVLFPLDLIVMILLAASMGAASYYWTLQALPAAWANWAYAALIFPLAYLIADFIEDLMLARTLKWALASDQNTIPDQHVVRLKYATRAKFITIFGTILIAAVALVLWLIVIVRLVSIATAP